jgi:hypothetical protein
MHPPDLLTWQRSSPSKNEKKKKKKFQKKNYSQFFNPGLKGTIIVIISTIFLIGWVTLRYCIFDN